MVRTTVNLREAKTSLSKLVERAAAGRGDHHRQVWQAQGAPRAAGPARLRKPSGWEGKVWVAGDFDEPLPPEILPEVVY
jgi:hypothetical protein